MQKKCEKCEAMFEAVRSDSRYCSKPCYYAVYAEQNVERRRAARAKYYEKNKEAQDERVRAWHAENHERVKEIKREHYHRNKQKIKDAAKAFAAANPDLRKQYLATYSASDAGRISSKASSHNRRARIKAVGGRFSRTDFVSLVARCGNMCVACGTKHETADFEADHIIPIKLGGSNDISNIQPLCRSCNRRKGANVKNYLESSDASVSGAPKPENDT